MRKGIYLKDPKYRGSLLLKVSCLSMVNHPFLNNPDEDSGVGVRILFFPFLVSKNIFSHRNYPSFLMLSINIFSFYIMCFTWYQYCFSDFWSKGNSQKILNKNLIKGIIINHKTYLFNILGYYLQQISHIIPLYLKRIL